MLNMAHSESSISVRKLIKTHVCILLTSSAKETTDMIPI